MAFKTFKADPDSELDYSVNWSQWLVSDSIAASQWFAEPATGIEFYNSGISTETSNTTYTFIKFTDGSEGDEYLVTNRVTTSSVPSRVEDSSFKIVLVEK